MKVLVVGYSNIAQRKVIPALDTLGLDGIDLATGRPDEVNSSALTTQLNIHSGYSAGLRASNAELCYISTVNSSHFELADMALDLGKHVIIDKPAVMNREQSLLLGRKARDKYLLLAESVVYSRHVRFQDVLRRLNDCGHIPRHIHSEFSIPPMDPSNYRYNKNLGGGVLYDMGAYIITPGRLIFGEDPIETVCWITEEQNGVDIGLRVMLRYSDSRTLSGYFGFAGEYRNQIRISGQDFYIDMDRFFAAPADLDTQAAFRSNNRTETWDYPGSDSFAIFIQEAIESLGTPGQERYLGEMEGDQAVLENLRAACGRGLSE